MSQLPFKISVLVFVRDGDGRQLLIRRAKEPNKDCWSPIGGKLEMSDGESPFECAMRETREEIGLELSEADLHLFAMISERGYEGSAHWLMFLFDCKKPLSAPPPDIREGHFAFFSTGEILSGKIKIPETDKKLLWDVYGKFADGGMAVMRADCSQAGRLSWTFEQTISKRKNTMDDNEKILKIFKDTDALMEGHFILRSGLHSGHFFQCARVCEHMDRVSELVSMLAKKLEGTDCDTVLAPAMGGLVLGQEVARQLGKRFIFAEKQDGNLVLRRNFKIGDGEKILIVEDVITRGGRVQECIDIVKAHGGKPAAVAVLVDRSEGRAKFEVPCVSLLEFSFPTYAPDAIPAELASIPACHPGS